MHNSGGRFRATVALAVLLALAGLIVSFGDGEAVLAASCTVASAADAGPGSLREKLADPTCSDIAIAVTDMITLLSDLPPVTRTVGVTGPGGAGVVINRPAGTAFTVGAGGNLTLTGLYVTRAAMGLALTENPGANPANNSAATVINSTFSGNLSAISIPRGTSATVTNSSISGNARNGLQFDGGSATVTGSSLSDNEYGAHFLSGSATLTNSVISGNYTAGLYFRSSGSAAVTSSTISNNNHGVYYLGAGDVTLTNSTISGNRTAGVTFNGPGAVTATNSTFYSNQIGLWFLGYGDATLTNTLLAKGEDANCGGSSDRANNVGANLADDTTCFDDGANGSIAVAPGAAGLKPAGLANNGGPTPTVALQPGSPAIDAGNNAICAAAPVGGVDQRGVSRTVGAGPRCDIGAYEAPAVVAAAITLDASTLTQPYTGTPRVVAATTLPAGLAYSVSYNGSTSPPTAAGSYPVIATVTAPGYIGSTSGTLVVAPAPQTITFISAAPTGAVYGGTYAVAASGGESGSPVVFSTPTPGICTVVGNVISFVAVGTCTVAADQAASANYGAASQATQSFAVAKATPTLTWTAPAGIVYGTTLGAEQLNATATVPGTFAYTPAAGMVLAAGSGQALAVIFTPTDVAHYTTAYASVTIDVAKAALQVAADNKIKVLGAANPPLTATITGFVNGQTLATSGVTGSPALSTTATATSGAGSYPIAAAAGTLAAANYQFSFVDGILSVIYASGGTCAGSAGRTVLQPVNADGTSVFKQGSTVPIKFRVCDANGTSVGTAGVVANFALIQRTMGTTSVAVNEAVDSTNPDTAFRWDASAQQWVFNLKTKDLAAGVTYTYRITLKDGTTVTFQFGLK